MPIIGNGGRVTGAGFRFDSGEAQKRARWGNLVRHTLRAWVNSQHKPLAALQPLSNPALELPREAKSFMETWKASGARVEARRLVIDGKTATVLFREAGQGFQVKVFGQDRGSGFSIATGAVRNGTLSW